MSTELTLYSTSECHLCELAYAMLKDLGLDVCTRVVDVAFDDALYHTYGLRIPVLVLGQQELAWPFTQEHIQSLVS